MQHSLIAECLRAAPSIVYACPCHSQSAPSTQALWFESADTVQVHHAALQVVLLLVSCSMQSSNLCYCRQLPHAERSVGSRLHSLADVILLAEGK